MMAHVYGRWDTWLPAAGLNTWERCTVCDKVAPGRAACGNVHFAPNNDRDYDWGNTRMVKTAYPDWRDAGGMRNNWWFYLLNPIGEG